MEISSMSILNKLKGLAMRTNTPKLDPSVVESFVAAQDMYSWTPDAPQIEKRAYQPLFVCCPLGKGGTEHHWIDGNYLIKDDEGHSHCAPAFTKDRFELWKANMGDNTFTVPLRTHAPPATIATPEHQLLGQRMYSAHIKGKIYKIRSDLIFLLDRLRHNGVVYNRQKINISFPYRILGGQELGLNRLSDEYIETGQAWFYVANNDIWEPIMEQGVTEGYFSPARIIHPRHPHWMKHWNQEPYYLFYPHEVLNNST